MTILTSQSCIFCVFVIQRLLTSTNKTYSFCIAHSQTCFASNWTLGHFISLESVISLITVQLELKSFAECINNKYCHLSDKCMSLVVSKHRLSWYSAFQSVIITHFKTVHDRLWKSEWHHTAGKSASPTLLSVYTPHSSQSRSVFH